MSDQDAIYNIGVVARMTGIPAATLRIWERRYGFPRSARTEGGHRLFDEREIERLRWVQARHEEGMQIRQAIRALEAREAQQTGQAEVIAPNVPPLDSTLAQGELLAQTTTDHLYIAILQKRLFESLIHHKLDDAEAIFNEAMALYTPEDIMLHIIVPTMAQIGSGWENGMVTISTEHLATHYLRQRLLLWMRSGPPAFDIAPTVLACAPNEYHEGSLMLLGALLRRRRWPVAYLGQSIPLADVAKFVQEVKPAAVVFAASSAESAEALTEWPHYMPEVAETGKPVIGYGGRVFNVHPEWRAKMRGLFLGTTLAEGVETLERILRSER